MQKENRPAEAGTLQKAPRERGGTAGIFSSFLACDGKQENSEESPFAIHGAGDRLAHVTRKRPLKTRSHLWLCGSSQDLPFVKRQTNIFGSGFPRGATTLQGHIQG
jgi:hypothetical protein